MEQTHEIPVRFSYYMIRVEDGGGRGLPAAAQLSGVIERLCSGEKRDFASGSELLALVLTWACPPSGQHEPL